MSPICFAQETVKDTIKTASETPFRKGRWLTGLTGFIGSGSTENTITHNKSISNRYRIEINTGKFVRDRINIGLSANMERSNFEEKNVAESTSETFFIGPKGTYYASNSEIGSIFFSLSPGYALYRDQVGAIIENVYTENTNKGGGFGFLFTFGFAYVIHDRVSFDLGLNYNVYWLDLNQENSINDKTDNVSFEVSNLSFSFGFKILLDSKPL
ncbi:hypothetical protein [Xanthomarina sp. GH4-25]|uniref:hypothetical protein n=1 Tax=Xanthomarina sp. GH4-25 TaxID=3349335 RepID=UPI000D67392F|nr:hypothetical protein DI383_00210 [Flavobacteriaceae bacterium LYZ1037]